MTKSDLIRRADVVRLLVERYKFTTSEATEILSQLPSAEAKWIPCSERLPDAEDCPMDCIVTRKNEFIGNFVDMAVAESEAPATEPEADKDSRGNMSLKPPGDSISRSDAKDKAKEIMYSILDDTDYNDIESMAHACLMMKIKILKMFDEFPSAEAVQRGW